MAEWLKATVLKTVGRKPRGFESHPLRHYDSALRIVGSICCGDMVALVAAEGSAHNS